MAAYAAVVPVKKFFAILLHYGDAALDPDQLNIIERGHKELKWLQGFLERLDIRSRKRMSVPLGRIVEALHELLEFCVTKFPSDDEHEDDYFVEQTYSYLETLKKIQEECCSLLEDEEEVVSSSSSSSSSSKMIGLRDERIELKEMLVDARNVHTVLFLAGMAGIGKTTLAREVYEDLDVSEWFECRVWVTLGNEWKSIEITEAILAQMDPDVHKMVTGGDQEEIAQRLKESLKLGKRCLIVLDGVWFCDDFQDYMERQLLDVMSSGSRVVLTTRIKDSNYTNKWNLFEKRLLNKKESWDLLREKVFAGGLCPPQLEDVGKKIAKKCDGLPLTIVTVADLLSKAKESLWIDVAEKKRHHLFIDAYDQISKVLYPSYEKLFDELKLCFLYLAVFPLKYEIHRSKLINLWNAEEILYFQFEEGDSPYLTSLYIMTHLDDRSLLMVYQRSTTYSLLFKSFQAIRICGLHSSWWHFCQREAKKIKFFHVLDCPEDGVEESIKGQNRLTFHNNVLFARKDVYDSIEKNCASTARSLLCFGPYHQYMVPICFGLKLLQRLDALNIRFYEFPLEVLELAKLMYLALTCNKQLPPSISKLEKLQYLIVHPHMRIKSCGAPSYMPMEIWDLEELKHLEVFGSDLPNPGDKSLGMLSTLLDVSTASCTLLYKLPKLEKVRIRIELTPDVAADPLCCSDHMFNLFNLESLKFFVMNPGCNLVVPHVASFPVLPSSLKKLSLSGLGYPWEEMRAIASLPCLLVLKLQCNAFHGHIWEVKELGFPVLQFLLIEGLDLVKLKGGTENFRDLHHLSINNCYKLEEIQMGDLEEVSRIEVVDSNPLVEKSIKLIMRDTISRLPEYFTVHYSWKSE